MGGKLGEIWQLLGELSKEKCSLLKKEWKFFLGCFFLTWIVAALFSLIIFFASGDIVLPWAIDESLSGTTGILPILWAVSLSPVIQELAFRWPIIITKEVMPKSSYWIPMALLLTLEFAVMHWLSIRFTLYCIIWAIIVTLLALKAKSILPSIIFHSLWNGIVIMLFLVT